MTLAISKFIRNLLQQHAMKGITDIAELSSKAGAVLNAVVVVMPKFDANEQPLYEYACATLIEGYTAGSCRTRMQGYHGQVQLEKYHQHLQQFIDALKNEQSVVELLIQNLPKE